MLPNPIQLSEIAAYVNLYGPPTVRIEIFVELISVLDDDDLTNLRSKSGNTSG
jgi:hypothetical protein